MPNRRLLAVSIANILAFDAYAADLLVQTDADERVDNNQCSLREALINANADNQSGSVDCAAGNGRDTITLPAAQTISLLTPLPNFAESLDIDGNGSTIERSPALGACVLDQNSTANEFRVLRVGGNEVTLSNMTLQGGCADGSPPHDINGGAVFSFGTRLQMTNVTVQNNAAYRHGGGVYGSNELTITDSVLRNNEALTGLGGGVFSNQARFALLGSTLENNSAPSGGGAASGASLSAISGCTFNGNTATSGNGGGVYSVYDSAVIELSRFSGNQALAGAGGAVAMSNQGLVTEVVDSTFIGNTAGTNGGGLSFGGAELALSNSVFADNHAADGGGLNAVGPASVLSSTFSANTAAAGGGGIAIDGALTLEDSTLADNSGAQFGDQLRLAGAAASVERTLLSGGTLGNCHFVDGSPHTGAQNQSTDASCAVLSSALVTPSELRLQPLADNGGLTLTISPGPGSVAIDGGGSGCPEGDQRGFNSPVGAACDVGALEVQEAGQAGPNFEVNTVDDAGDSFCGDQPGQCSLREAVLAANSDPQPSIISFDPQVFATQQTITLSEGVMAITSPTVITGPGQELLTVDATLASQHFLIDDGDDSSNVDVALSGLRLVNGSNISFGKPGGAIQARENLALDAMTLSGNSAHAEGGGLYFRPPQPAVLTVSDSTFSQNRVFEEGGGLYARTVSGSSISITGSLFDRNQSMKPTGRSIAAGLYFELDGTTLHISDTTISGNSTTSVSAARAGGMSLRTTGGSTELVRLQVLDNISGIDFPGGQARGSGGGLHLDLRQSTLSLRDSTISGNVASGSSDGGKHGGGVVLELSDSTVDISATEISNNSAADLAGGLYAYAYQSSITVTNSTLSGNSAGTSGGGMYAYLYDSPSSLTLDQSTVSNNVADTQGSEGNGGGLDVSGTIGKGTVAPTLSVRGTTVSGNADDLRGPGVAAPDISVTGDVLFTLTDSLIGDAGETGLTEAPLGNPDASNNLIGGPVGGAIDPLLSPLADNGGLNQTHLPLAGSPLIDRHGVCAGNDQRGLPRAGDGNGSASAAECDVGAVAFQYVAISAADETAEVSENGGAQALPNLLLNETDPSDDHPASFSVVAVDGASGDVGMPVALMDGQITIDANGDASFDALSGYQHLAAGQTALVGIDYTVSDGNGSDVARVDLTINGENDAPVAHDGAIATVERVPVSGSFDAADVDDGDQLSFQLLNQPTGGSVSLTLTLGEFRFDPGTDFDALAPGESQQVSFLYRATDLSNGSDDGSITVTVIGGTPVDLVITKSDGVDDVGVGDRLTYTINVLNSGPFDAVAATVQDLLPPALIDAVWSCEEVGNPPATACGAASGMGDIDQSVDIANGDALVFLLSATVDPGFVQTEFTNTATVASASANPEIDESDNSASDTNLIGKIFADGFEQTALVTNYESRSVRLAERQFEARLPAADSAPQLIAKAHAADGSGAFVLIEGRRIAGQLQSRANRLEHGQWVVGEWHSLEGAEFDFRW